jgi:hypothetical protein
MFKILYKLIQVLRYLGNPKVNLNIFRKLAEVGRKLAYSGTGVP